ncbi:hypothetical protein PRIPAC_98023 [Pristionchus pacificus]|nr:hypothetical protein PRIPAC_98023 [Pristionchus pacificus]
MEERDVEPHVHTPFFRQNGNIVAFMEKFLNYRSTDDRGVDQSAATQQGEDDSSKSGHCRLYVVGLATLVCSATTANAFAFTYSSVLGSPQEISSITSHSIDPRTDMILPRSPVMGVLYGASPVGSILGILTSLFISRKLSIRYQVMICLILSALPTLLIPIAFDMETNQRVPIIAVLRFVQGLGSSVMVPLMINLAHQWTAEEEATLVLALVSSQAQIGVMITSLTAGLLGNTFGWRTICNLSAVYTAIIFALWSTFYFDVPSMYCCCLGEKEKELLSKDERPRASISPFRLKNTLAVFGEMMRNLSVWAVLVAAFGSYGGISPLFLFQTSILKRSLKLTNEETCIVACISCLLHLVIKALGCLFYFKGYGSGNWRTKAVNFAACALTGCVFAIVASNYYEGKYARAGLFALAQALSGFSYSGYHCASNIVAKRFSMIILSIFITMSIFTSMIEPALIAFYFPDHKWDEWRLLIFLHGILLIPSNVFYFLVADAPPRLNRKDLPVRQNSDMEMVERPPPNEFAD